ncbi:MAG: hypothetical protein JSR72_22155 [Proteobacteria bacterium]|nr:hypothetical protein [Pseudomonadota bacterium]
MSHDFAFEVALRGEESQPGALAAWFVDGPLQALTPLPGLKSLDQYLPIGGASRDPYNHDGVGPLMLLMLVFRTRSALNEARSAIAAAFERLPASIAATGAGCERLLYPVSEGGAPAPLQAPFSYVVRYHRPADDEVLFVRNYLATHPHTQARLPAIRSILCYVPIEANAANGRLADANYMVGNEVVFDDADAFGAAMASPAREELRAHYREFPRFTGANTHYPMQRTRLFES